MREEYDLLEQIRAAQQSADAADGLIRQYMPYVKSETAKFLKRIPRVGHDDELNIAMFAFYESILSYRQEKGAFLRFASTGIRNRLIDYYRKEKRHQGLVSLEQPIDSEGEDSRTLMDHIDTGRDEAAELAEQSAAKEEILHFSAQLASFGLSLGDIADSCPRQDRTLAACQKALAFAIEYPELLDQLVQTKKLPLAQLCAGAGVERKTLERHRKYMIAILLAYTNGFEIIRGHLRQLSRKGGQPV